MGRRITFIQCLTVAALVVSAMASASAADLVLVDKGKSDYEIIRADNTPASAVEGAKELQALIRTVTGATLPIKQTPTAGKKSIVIGAHPLAKAAGITAAGLKKDGFTMRVVGQNLFLVGNDKDARGFFGWSPFIESSHAGSYFAVIEFARRYLGVEWYMPGPNGMAWKSKSALGVPANLAVKEEPRFMRRMIEGAWLTRPKQRLVDRGILKRIYYRKDIARECEVWGRRMLLGNDKFVPFQHAWFMFMPAKEANRWSDKAYGKTNPEYYALVNGKRTNSYRGTRHGGQLCTSNPDVIKIYADNIIRHGKNTGSTGFSLSPNDGGGMCECANCKALDSKDPVTGESVLADRMLRFSNQVAEQVARGIPDARLGVHAYGTTRHPPVASLDIHKNVYVSDVYNMLPNLWHSGPEQRGRIIRDLSVWRKQAKHVTMSSYYNIYGHWSLPWDTTDVVGEVTKILAKYDSSDGMVMNNCRYFGLAPGVDGARLWVLARLLWNPNQSTAKLQKQFYSGAFGPEAGRHIEEYFNVINRSMIRAMKQRPMDWTNPSGALECTYPMTAYLPILEECRALIDKAVAAAAKENERIQWRVDRVARGWRFAELTMDAARYARMATSGKDREKGLSLSDVWQKATTAGQLRRAMVNDPENYYAIGQGSVDECTRQRPLGIVEKIPESVRMKIGAPLLKNPFTLDGKLDDALWKKLTPTRNFKENRKGGDSVVTTWVKAFRLGDALVLGYHCGEPKMGELSVVDKPDSIWEGDVAEFYLSSNGSRMDFMQFLVNPNSIGKAFFMRGDRGMDSKWNPAWEYKAHKGKDYWSVEMKIPLAALGLNPASIKTTTPFVGFFRERYTGANENSGWTPTLGGFAQPSKFGRMLFTNKPVTSDVKRKAVFSVGFEGKSWRKNISFGGESPEPTLTSKGPQEGKRSLKVLSNGFPPKHASVSWAKIPVKPGGTYSASAMFRINHAEENKNTEKKWLHRPDLPKLRIIFTDAKGKSCVPSKEYVWAGSVFQTKTDGWKDISKTFTVPKAARQVKLTLFFFAKGEYQIDGIKVESW
jgi:Domain of unknown function (DUF4838)